MPLLLTMIVMSDYLSYRLAVSLNLSGHSTLIFYIQGISLLTGCFVPFTPFCLNSIDHCVWKDEDFESRPRQGENNIFTNPDQHDFHTTWHVWKNVECFMTAGVVFTSLEIKCLCLRERWCRVKMWSIPRWDHNFLKVVWWPRLISRTKALLSGTNNHVTIKVALRSLYFPFWYLMRRLTEDFDLYLYEFIHCPAAT